MPKRFRTSSLLEFNIQQYLEREFVNEGFYVNVPSGFVSTDGQRGDILRRVNGNVYESFTNGWVAETDATGVPSYETIDTSGVYVDGVFHARGSAPYRPAIDFRNGRVVFEGTAVPSTAEVLAEFSYKRVFIDFPGSNFVNQLFNEFRDNVDFTPHSVPSGIQRQLPLVVIDLQDGFNTPGELGGTKNVNQSVVFHVLSTDKHEINAISDFLSRTQYRKVILGVDFNVVPELFTPNGDRASTYINYSDMQASGSLLWQKIYVDETRIRERSAFYNFLKNRVDWTVNLLFLNNSDL